MTKIFVLCKHPQSSQAVYDVVQFLSTNKEYSIHVYGLQNNTPSIARCELNSNVTLKSIADDKLDVADLATDLKSFKPDTFVVMNMLNIATTIVDSLVDVFENDLKSTHIVVQYENSRDSTLNVHTQKMAAHKDRFKERIVYASISELPYLVTVPSELQNVTMDDARQAIGFPKDKKLILSLGRMDTSIMAFAEVAKTHDDATLVIPMDPFVKDFVSDIFNNEMGSLAREDRLIIIKNMASMSNTEASMVIRAVDVVVHANHVTHFNPYVTVAHCFGKPQVTSEATSYDNTFFVPSRFSFYTFDDLGGKVNMACPKDIAKATCSALAANIGTHTFKIDVIEKMQANMKVWVHQIKKVEVAKEDVSEIERYKREIAELKREIEELTKTHPGVV